MNIIKANSDKFWSINLQIFNSMLQSCASSCRIYSRSWIFFITIIATVYITGSVFTILNISINFFLFFIIINLFFMLFVSWCLCSRKWISLSLRLRSFIMFFIFLICLWFLRNFLFLNKLTLRTFFERLLRSFSFVSCRRSS